MSVSPSAGTGVIFAFDVLMIVALFLNVAVLLPALLSSQIHRMRTWYSFIALWILYSLVYLLLLGHQTGGSPNFALCVTQASFIYAAPAVMSTASHVIIIELYFRLKCALCHGEFKQRLTIPLLILPLAIGIATFLVPLVVGIKNPGSVERTNSGVYCHIKLNAPTYTTGVVVAINTIIMLALEVHIGLILYRSKATLLSPHFPKHSPFPLALFTRAICHSAFFLIVMCLTGMGFAAIHSDSGEIALQLLLPFVSLSASVAFGTQKDIIRAWSFWKKGPPESFKTP